MTLTPGTPVLFRARKGAPLTPATVWEVWGTRATNVTIHDSEGRTYVRLASALVEGVAYGDYCVTACADHGVRVTGDFASLATYCGVADACRADLAREEHAHHIWHAVEGTECWQCCPDMTVDPYGLTDPQ